MYLIEPMPASSEMDMLLAKAEPFSNRDNSFEIIYLRKGKKNLKLHNDR